MDIRMIEPEHRYTLALPGEGVDETGQEKIAHLMKKAIAKKKGVGYTASDIGIRWPDTWTWRWHQPNGKYAGNLTKRIQSLLFKEFGVKTEPAMMTEIGNLAKIHSSDALEIHFDLTHDLEATLGKFGDETTCFHVGDNTISLLLGVGAWAMRLWAGPKSVQGIGRMWIVPWAGLGPEPIPADPLEPYALLGFNAYGMLKKEYQNQQWEAEEGGGGQVRKYGQMQTLDYSRLLALFLGQSYVHIHLAAMGKTTTGEGGPFFFNNKGRSAVLVAPPDVVAEFKEKKNEDGDFVPTLVNLPWSAAFVKRVSPVCSICGRGLGRKDGDGHVRVEVVIPEYKGRVCDRCAENEFRKCLVCEKRVYKNLIVAWRVNGHSFDYCTEHKTFHTIACSNCGRPEHQLNIRRLLVRNRNNRLVFANYCTRCYPGDKPSYSCADCGVSFIPKKGQDDIYDKLEPDKLVVQCPRCRAKAKRVAAHELPDPDGDEEIDPVDLIFEPEPVKYKPGIPSIYQQLYHELTQDETMPYAFGREALWEYAARIPEQRPVRAEGWVEARYVPGDGVMLLSPAQNINDLQEWPPDRIGDALLYEDGLLLHCTENATLLAAATHLPIERPRTRMFDPMMKFQGYFKYDDELGAITLKGTPDELMAVHEMGTAKIGAWSLRSLMIESPALMHDVYANWRLNDRAWAGEAHYSPSGQIVLYNAQGGKLFDAVYPELESLARQLRHREVPEMVVLKQRYVGLPDLHGNLNNGIEIRGEFMPQPWREIQLGIPWERKPNGDIRNNPKNINQVYALIAIAEEDEEDIVWSPAYAAWGRWSQVGAILGKRSLAVMPNNNPQPNHEYWVGRNEFAHLLYQQPRLIIWLTMQPNWRDFNLLSAEWIKGRPVGGLHYDWRFMLSKEGEEATYIYTIPDNCNIIPV